MSRVKSCLLVLACVLCLYVSACCERAIKVDEGRHGCMSFRVGTLVGVGALLLGWMPPFCIPWSANVLLLAGVIALLLERYKMAIILSWAAVLAGLTTPVFWLLGGFEELLVGYYRWQASLLLFAVGVLVVRVFYGPPFVFRKPDGSPNWAAAYTGPPESNACSDSVRAVEEQQ